MGALHFGAALCSCISLLCLLLGLGTDYWILNSSMHIGLWNYCNGEACYSLGVSSMLGSLHGIRTLMLLGVIAGAVSLSGLCAMKWQPSLGNISMTRIACSASLAAAICIMIAMSIFSGNTFSSIYGWSFALAWGSFPLYLLTGALTYTLHKRTASIA